MIEGQAERAIATVRVRVPCPEGPHHQSYTAAPLRRGDRPPTLDVYVPAEPPRQAGFTCDTAGAWRVTEDCVSRVAPNASPWASYYVCEHQIEVGE